VLIKEESKMVKKIKKYFFFIIFLIIIFGLLLQISKFSFETPLAAGGAIL